MMPRITIIGDASLYLGDCRDILPKLRGVDAVVTDPPYGTKVTVWDDPISDVEVATILNAASSGYAAFFYSNTRLATLLTAVRTAGWDAWVMVWHKPNAMGFERRFAPQWVPVVVAYRGNPPFWGQDYVSCPITPHDFDHPTPKPVPVTQWLVERVAQPDQTVLDPYMGSGTTGVACALSGRKFIGIEREPAYFDIACRRIEEAYRQPRLFDEPRPKPVQPGMFDGEAA